MSKGALLTGTVGGIMGAVTAVFGIVWVFVHVIFSNEIVSYCSMLSNYLIGMIYPDFPRFYALSQYPIPYFPSASLFGVASFILAMLLIVTGILFGLGFYGTYKIGGGIMGVVGLASSVKGMVAGALLIIVGNLTTGYVYAYTLVEMASVPFYPVTTPNFVVMWIGFIVLGVTCIILGSASMRVREMTEKPSAFYAAGTLSILCAVDFIAGGLVNIVGGHTMGGLLRLLGLMNQLREGSSLAGIYIIGFALIFIAFILWAWAFYSSRSL
ncbi:MAG: hypothetical protein KIH08_05895 [Candidatus Freyarchaeota archaeon]|nr:hypothetical protein [Candidatus Jordarchaeia archaeon]MBS7270406.1 hypothetical protein [Candidatus Jordarchaeia archaeon]MBS7281199.1 hypothetical protein [Candidatus Jordarchaeia archaeon]